MNHVDYIAKTKKIDLDADLMCAIAEYQGSLTANTLSAFLGGISHQDAEIAIRRFSKIYQCKEKMGKDGRVLYKFKYPLVLLNKKDDKKGEGKDNLAILKKAAAIGSLLLVLAFVVWFVVLSIYMILVFLLVIVVVFFLNPSNTTNVLIINNQHTTIIHNHYYSSEGGFVEQVPQEKGLTVRKTLSYLFKDGPHGLAFYKKIITFAFGPEAFPDNRFRYMNELKKFSDCVVSHRGVVSPADWVQYSGQSLEKATMVIEGYARQYDAFYCDPVNDADFRLYAFPFYYDSHKTDRYNQLSIWEHRYIPEYTGNSWKANLSIILLLLFGLAVSFEGIKDTLFAYIPLVYISILLAAPILRFPFFFKKRSNAKQENIRREGLQRVFQSIISGSTQSVDLEKYNGKQLALEYYGEIDTTSGVDVNNNIGFSPFYHFPILSEELNCAMKARNDYSQFRWKPMNPDMQQEELKESDELAEKVSQ